MPSLSSWSVWGFRCLICFLAVLLSWFVYDWCVHDRSSILNNPAAVRSHALGLTHLKEPMWRGELGICSFPIIGISCHCLFCSLVNCILAKVWNQYWEIPASLVPVVIHSLVPYLKCSCMVGLLTSRNQLLSILIHVRSLSALRNFLTYLYKTEQLYLVQCELCRLVCSLLGEIWSIS